jgi:hypothetical protein
MAAPHRNQRDLREVIADAPHERFGGLPNSDHAMKEGGLSHITRSV